MSSPSSGVPDPLIAGATVRIALDGLPVEAGRVARILFRGPRSLDVSAPVVDGRYLAAIAADDSRSLVSGRYRYQVLVTESSGDKWVWRDGQTTIEKSFEFLRDGEALSHAERVYDILTKAIEGRIDADVESYQLNGRTVTKIPLAQLVRLRQQYATAIKRERGGQTRETIRVVLR